MIFKYLEDYQKMKKLEEKLSKILVKWITGCCYQKVKDFVNELYNEMRDLKKFVKKMQFLKVDYDDGRFYTIKFFGTNTFLAQAEFKFDVFSRFLNYLGEEEYDDVYEMLKYDIIPGLLKIYGSLIQRGLYYHLIEENLIQSYYNQII